MDQTLKNRLVGAGVLLALAVILLPLLLDGANREALMGEMRMPPPPEVPQAQQLLQGEPSGLPAMREEVAQAHAPAEPEVAPTVESPSAAEAQPSTESQPSTETQPPNDAPESGASAAPASPPAVADKRLGNLAEAWDVQVAAGSSPEGAARLLSRLEAAGYKARVRHEGGIHRVVVGPLLRREDAQALRTALAADARVGKPQGVLVRYIP